MNIFGKTIIPFLLVATMLASCNSSLSTPATNPTQMMETAIAIAQTQFAMTQAAIPTVTFPPSTNTAPNAYVPYQSPPSDKLDHALAIAPKIYTLFPYIDKANSLYGEYSGCTKTYDFENFVTYVATLPMETVRDGFVNYFSTEKWEFTEPVSDLVIGYDHNIPRTIYDVYRISSKGSPAFERLRVILTDETAGPGLGKDYIEVRAELTHVETKENFASRGGPPCSIHERWLWIRLSK